MSFLTVTVCFMRCSALWFRKWEKYIFPLMTEAWLRELCHLRMSHHTIFFILCLYCSQCNKMWIWIDPAVVLLDFPFPTLLPPSQFNSFAWSELRGRIEEEKDTAQSWKPLYHYDKCPKKHGICSKIIVLTKTKPIINCFGNWNKAAIK